MFSRKETYQPDTSIYASNCEASSTDSRCLWLKTSRMRAQFSVWLPPQVTTWLT